jgi:uncharacterized Zn-binding protein involved in type VI secretion
MSLPAARSTDMHVCPAWNAPVSPHTGGPIAAGCPTVLIGNMPAARLSDATTCAGPPGTVTSGSPVVLIGGQPAARVSDLAGHGGVISPPGCPTVLIGGPAPPPPPPPPPEPEPPEEEEE